MPDQAVNGGGEPRRARFGLFEFEIGTGELWREGTPVRLQSQPARVLALLVEHAGQVVTRETLRDAVWGTETFVDFDRGLNFCIAQIRSALGDTAEAPRYVRTLPKRGYQFIAPVERVGAPSATPAAAPAVRRRDTRYAAIAALLVLAAAALVAARWLTMRPPASPPITVAVARFDNETDNPEITRIADGLTDAVTAELTASGGGRLGVIGNAAILRQSRERRDLRAVASSLRADYIVLGQVQRNGTQLRILAHLIRMPEQTHVSVARFDRALDDPLRLQSDVARQIAAQFSPKALPR